MPRKQPFSGKQKKKQLKERRDKKQGGGSIYDDDSVQVVRGHGDVGGHSVQSQLEVLHVHEQPATGKDFDPNRFRLHFLKISPEEMNQRKEAARKAIKKAPQEELEISFESVHGSDNSLDFPKRPAWNYNLTKAQLDDREQKYFREYLQKLLTAHKLQELSYFELNLETWRQLWRVTEISDVLLLIADVRYPAIHLPPSLYHYLRKDLRREVILVLNKVDLSPPSLVAAWRAYLASVFPEAHIVCFTSFPKPPELSASGIPKKQKRKAVKPLGPRELLEVCRGVVKDRVDLSSWQHKLDSADTSTSAPDKQPEVGEAAAAARSYLAPTAEGFDPDIYQKFRDGVLTIGCIGYTNVGKSSLLNGLVGKKVVSVSRTPGHTKYLQTIFLTHTVRLCDCPGLVFPSYVDKGLQILSGIFPIAQVRDPYTAVGYLAGRLDLPQLLRLTHPNATDRGPKASEDLEWSAFDICEAWAIKSGYFTAKASRPDVYRAGNQLLRMSVEGRLRLCMVPPKYFQQQEVWNADPFACRLAKHLEKQVLAGEKAEESSESESEGEENLENSDGDEERESEEEEEEEEEVSCASINPFSLLSDD